MEGLSAQQAAALSGPGELLLLAILAAILWWAIRNSHKEAVFVGFRVVREHPAALGFWALFALALSFAVTCLLVGLMGHDLAKLPDLEALAARDPAAALATMARLAPAYASILAVALIFNAILGAAMIRAVVRPGDDRFGYLRLGADEVRLLGLELLTLLVFFGVYIGLSLVAGVALGLIVAVARPAADLGIVLVFVGLAAAMTYIAVRLSLAPALTFQTRRLSLFGSWTLTKRHFWPVLATYVVNLYLIVLVSFLGWILTFSIATILNGGDLTASLKSTMAEPDLSSLQAYFTPLRLVQSAFNAGVSALVWPLMFTPSVAIYLALSRTVAAEEVFS
jgi:hypothetical protein